jgi:hypothetical protein
VVATRVLLYRCYDVPAGTAELELSAEDTGGVLLLGQTLRGRHNHLMDKPHVPVALDALIELIGRDRFEAEANGAWATGQATDVPHELSNRLWFEGDKSVSEPFGGLSRTGS